MTMSSHNKERLEVADRVKKSLAVADTLTPVQARSFVRCLQTTWQVPTITWGDNESIKQLDDAHRLIHSAGIFQRIEGSTSLKAVRCYRRAAELLEWLSRADDPLCLIAPIELFAAGAYQLAGLPAMASSHLSQAEFRDDGSKLYARFLKADFDGVIHSIIDFWQLHPELRNREATEQLLASDDHDKISWYITIELVRSLGLITDSLRHSDTPRFERSISKLDALDRFALRNFSDDSSMLITLLFNTAKAFGKSSIYRPVNQLAGKFPEHRNKLHAFARGQFSRGRGILWSSQHQGLNRLLSESSFTLCTPTGSGKTLVATFALIKELILQDNNNGIAPLGLYLVPSRALAGEVETKLNSELGQDLIITGLYGGTDWGVADNWLTADRPTVLIATVEKADALMRYLGPFLVARLRLLIIDEAHQVVPEDNENTRHAFADHNSRSIKLEAFVSRLLTQSPSIVRIALTAVAGGASLPVARWVEGREEAMPVGTRFRSTRQLIGMLETAPNIPGRILLDLMDGQHLYVRGRDDPAYLPLRTPAMPQLPHYMRNSIYRFNELFVLWTALYLGNERRRILISVAQEPEKTMDWYKEALELDDWQNVIRFRPPEDKDQLNRFLKTRAACVDYCGENSFEVFLLERGIATNYGQMPQRLRRLMTDLIDRGICPITVATATLTEGVNLPFDLIFVTALKRRFFNSATGKQIISPVSISEFNNLAGRAGRPGVTNGIEGITLVAVPQRPSTTAKGEIETQRRQIRRLRQDYDDLMSRLQIKEVEDRGVSSPLALLLRSISESALDLLGIEGDQFLEWLESITPNEISKDAGMGMTSMQDRLADSIDELDSVLISSLEELSLIQSQTLDGADAEAFLIALWKNTFSCVAALQETWLEQAFIRRGRAVIESIYPDADERKRLYKYGLPPYLGRRFEDVAPNIFLKIEASDSYGFMSARERLMVFESICNIISNDRGFGFRVRDTVADDTILNNWRKILAWWMQGEDTDGPEPKLLRSWQRFVTDNIEFRLGTAIGAVVSMAWADGVKDQLEVPSLEKWRDTTGLPWFGFWARELLRWGTLDPFVAFSLAQGLAYTRNEAAQLRPDFDSWLCGRYTNPQADDLIDPQLFIEWQQSLSIKGVPRTDYFSIKAELTGTTGQRGRYYVIPVSDGTSVVWIDASGYELARSHAPNIHFGSRAYSSDFELEVDNGTAIVYGPLTQ